MTMYLTRFIEAINNDVAPASIKFDCLTIMYYNLKKKRMLYIIFENELFHSICSTINNWLLFELKDYNEFLYFHHKLT
jgi:hypothetical protein